MKRISDPRLLRQRLVLGDDAQRRLFDASIAPTGHPTADEYLRRAGVTLAEGTVPEGTLTAAASNPDQAPPSSRKQSRILDDSSDLSDAQTKVLHQLEACLRAVDAIVQAIE